MTWTKARAEQVLREIVERAQRDPAFRQLCLRDPAAAVKETGGEDLPPDFRLQFVDNQYADMTVVLPDPVGADAELSDSELATLSGGVGSVQLSSIQSFAFVNPNLNKTCFAAGTPVLMADGSSRPIEQLRVGDSVLGFDEATKRVVPSTVDKTLRHAAQPLYRASVDDVGHQLLVTSNHHFYVAGSWRAIGELAPKTELYHFDPALREASPRRLFALAETGRSETVYNLEVAQTHTYFAAGLLVHNGGVFKYK